MNSLKPAIKMFLFKPETHLYANIFALLQTLYPTPQKIFFYYSNIFKQSLENMHEICNFNEKNHLFQA